MEAAKFSALPVESEARMLTKTTRWLEGLAAGIEKPGDLKARAKEKTALHLSRCSDDEASDLRAMLGVENADLSRQLAVVQAPSSMTVLMRRQEIVRGALQAFDGRK
jgi:hypothetical protein